MKRYTTAELGQGLVEYALILVLVALAVVVVLTLFGPQLKNVYCEVVTGLNNGTQPDACVPPVTDTVVITRADYDVGDEELHLDATSNGGYNPSATLTASPGGVMEAKSDHYHLKYTLTGCPCTVTVTSSQGGSATVTVP